MRRKDKVKQRLKDIVSFWQSIWGKLLVFIFCGSIVALFIASFCLDKRLTLSVMNEWISLVVGMAALILGIISLFLSFYNVEQSNEIQKDTLKIMAEVKAEITNEIKEMKISMNDNFSDIRYSRDFQGDKDIRKITAEVDKSNWRRGINEQVFK